MIKIGKDISRFSTYSCQPKTKRDLICAINDRITKYGPECDLNDIDTSLIDDMSYLFYSSKFNGNISRWDVSNVVNMNRMFSLSEFNGDISKWDVHNVRDMSYIFYGSNFYGNIREWEISNDCDITPMQLNLECIKNEDSNKSYK